MRKFALDLAAWTVCALMMTACGTEATQLTRHASLQAALQEIESTDDCLSLCLDKGESSEDCALWCDKAAWEDKDEGAEECYQACDDKGESADVCEAYCDLKKRCDWSDKEYWGDQEDWKDHGEPVED